MFILFLTHFAHFRFSAKPKRVQSLKADILTARGWQWPERVKNTTAGLRPGSRASQA